MKLIIDINDNEYKGIKEYPNNITSYPVTIHIYDAIRNGIPLDSVKAEIEQNAYPIVHGVNNHEKGMTLYGILQVLDNIDKVESGDK